MAGINNDTDMTFVTLILSLIVALATVTYTIVNYYMYKESKATRLQKGEPIIVAFLKSTSSHSALGLYVKNIGEGCAKNVVVHVLKDYHLFGKDDKLQDFRLFNDGVSMYPPQYELNYLLDSWTNIRDYHINDYIELSIEYDGLDGRHYSNNNFQLNLNEVARIYSTPPEDAFTQIPYYIKKLDETLAKLADCSKK